MFRTMVEFKLYIATSEIRTQNFQYSETFTFLNIALDLGFSSQERIISIENKLVHWTPNNYPSEGKVSVCSYFLHLCSVTYGVTAISSDSRPPKFEMLDINSCF